MTEDHDLLIRVDTHLDALCKQVCKIEKNTNDMHIKLDEQKEFCLERQTKNFEMLDRRPKWNIILWIFGGVFLCILMLGGMMLDNKQSIQKYHPQEATSIVSNEESN